MHDNTSDVRERSAVRSRLEWSFQRGWSSPCQPWFRIYRWSPAHMPYWGYWGLVLGKREYRLWWEGEVSDSASDEAVCRVINLVEQMTLSDLRAVTDYLNELVALEGKRASEKRACSSDTTTEKETP